MQGTVNNRQHLHLLKYSFAGSRELACVTLGQVTCLNKTMFQVWSHGRAPQGMETSAWGPACLGWHEQ